MINHDTLQKATDILLANQTLYSTTTTTIMDQMQKVIDDFFKQCKGYTNIAESMARHFNIAQFDVSNDTVHEEFFCCLRVVYAKKSIKVADRLYIFYDSSSMSTYVNFLDRVNMLGVIENGKFIKMRGCSFGKSRSFNYEKTKKFNKFISNAISINMMGQVTNE